MSVLSQASATILLFPFLKKTVKKNQIFFHQNLITKMTTCCRCLQMKFYGWNGQRIKTNENFGKETAAVEFLKKKVTKNFVSGITEETFNANSNWTKLEVWKSFAKIFKAKLILAGFSGYRSGYWSMLLKNC